jgi:hypothetical protein
VLKAKDPLFSNGKMPATQPVFERYVKWIQEYLAAKGIRKRWSGSVTMPDRRESSPSCSGRRATCRRWRRYRFKETT